MSDLEQQPEQGGLIREVDQIIARMREQNLYEEVRRIVGGAKNLRRIIPECCYTCQAMQVDSGGWFCTLEGGPRWAEFDMPFRHVCDEYAGRDEFHPYDVEGAFDVEAFVQFDRF